MTDRAALSADALTLGYDKRQIIDGLSLDIAQGELTVLIGPNGCGKSTILRALAGLHPVTAGRVVVNGRDLAGLGSKALARQVGILSQGASVPDGLSVEDLVRQGRYPHRSLFGPWRDEDSAAVRRALDLTGLTAMRDTPVDRLSGGQRQRAWIAMSLAQETDILLLDEPTTYLDIGHQIEVLDLMRRLVDDNGATVVAVLHDMIQAARHADRIILLHQGRILAEGRPAEVLTPKHLETAFGVRVTVLEDPLTGAPICLPVGSCSR